VEVAQAAVYAQINTNHINTSTMWAERTVDEYSTFKDEWKTVLLNP
jgi:hypothetical protein